MSQPPIRRRIRMTVTTFDQPAGVTRVVEGPSDLSGQLANCSDLPAFSVTLLVAPFESYHSPEMRLGVRGHKAYAMLSREASEGPDVAWAVKMRASSTSLDWETIGEESIPSHRIIEPELAIKAAEFFAVQNGLYPGISWEWSSNYNPSYEGPATGPGTTDDFGPAESLDIPF